MKIKSKGTKLDFTATAASVVSRAIGEDLFDGSPLVDPAAGKDPKAIERGRAADPHVDTVYTPEWAEPQNPESELVQIEARTIYTVPPHVGQNIEVPTGSIVTEYEVHAMTELDVGEMDSAVSMVADLLPVLKKYWTNEQLTKDLAAKGFKVDGDAVEHLETLVADYREVHAMPVTSSKVAHIDAIDRQVDQPIDRKPVDVQIVTSRIRNPA